ncbi:MAG: FAD-dependent oxidoreductase [Lapillicoccus sp.]
MVAGIVGAACAHDAGLAGWDVVLVNRDRPGAGTTSRDEGNLVVSAKGPRPRLASDARQMRVPTTQHLGHLRASWAGRREP